MKKVLAGTISGLLIVAPLFAALPAQAAVADWHQAATLVPKSTTDFASDNFKKSIGDLKATGANYVGLVVPYYQGNTGSTDIQAGWNTPTDASLVAAIQYAHSQGLGVTLKPHVEVYDGSWRAYINPGDRTTWFTNYGNRLKHLAGIAKAQNVEMMVIGTEMVSMAAHNMHPTNTANWVSLIEQVRARYSGKLTYGANSTSNNDSPFLNEKRYIAFWDKLDYAGLSVYYGLNSDNSVQGLKGAWDYWNNNDIKGFAQSVSKPVMFLEIGYRSLDGAHYDPWNWQRQGGVNETEQSNAYEALMSYWNDYPYVVGVYWWEWDTNPNAGGSGSSDYTPQNKAAEGVMTRWFTNPTTPSPQPQNPSFDSSATANPSGTTVGNSVTVQASIQSLTSSVVSGAIVDIEIYNSSNQRVFQQFYEGQNFGSNERRNYSPLWTPTAAGTYRVTIGVFSSGWGSAYHWNNSATSITVAGTQSPPPNPNPPPPQGNVTTNIWWPTEGATLSGTQPLKAMLEGRDVGTYKMYWQVDGGGLVEMYDSPQDYPHKQAEVNFTGWNWKGSGPYTLNFVSKGGSGGTIGQKAVNIYAAQ